MTRVVLAHPSDFWVNTEMGSAIYEDDPREAMGYFRTALAIRPQLAILHDAIGVMCFRQRRWQEAIAFHRNAIGLEPGEAWFHCNHAWALLEAGQPDDAIAEARDALRLNPGCDIAHAAISEAFWRQQRAPEALEEARQFVRCARPQKLSVARSRLRDLLLLMGRYPEARDAWREGLADNPTAHDEWFGFAELCLFLGDEDGYRHARTDLLKRFGDSPDPVTCERTAKACLLLDGDPAELKAAAALADRAATNEAQSEVGYPHVLFARGLAAHRMGRFDEAITIMRGKAASSGGPSPRLVVAMGLHRNGDIDQARQVLSTTVSTSDWNQRLNAGDREPYWVAQVLRREAESLVEPKAQANLSSPPASMSPAARK